MIEYFRSIGGKLKQVDGFVEGCWIDVTDPDPSELEALSLEHNVPLDYLTGPLDLDERPHFEKDDGIISILMQTPYYLGEHSDIPYDTVPLGIIHTDHCLITVCTLENRVLHEIKNGRIRHVSTAKRNRFTLQIFLRTAQRFLIDLRQINKQVDAVEDRLESATQNKELLDLLKLEKSLVYFQTAVKANELMMERVKRDRTFEMYADDQELLDDVLIENMQAIEMTGITISILSSMMGTFAAVIQNNVNAVVKVLTLTTIFIAIPTLITGLFGMNVGIPWEGRAEGFWWVLGIAMVLIGFVVFLFRRLRWF